jgi:hypothetical protein
MSDLGLGNDLFDWFERTKGNPNRWRESYVGRVIRGNLVETGNWKNAPRGDPKKGYAAMREKLL